jgi:hypothetical protein
MGIITSGIPSEIALELAKLNGSDVFIETGTYQGDTTRWAARHFQDVYTIERAEVLFREFGPQLSQLKGVRPLLGDSRQALPLVLKEVGQRNCVVWLDGHWSGGHTAGSGDECPLLDELSALAGRKHDIILIDDARLFLSAPPQPHIAAQWPTMMEIIGVLSGFNPPPFVQIVDDVIFAVHDNAPLRDCLVQYARSRAESFWNTFVTLQRGMNRQTSA